MLGRLSNMRHARRPASSLLPRITKRQNYQGAPQRPILHQRMEAAARAGDMEAVRRALEGARLSPWQQLLVAALMVLMMSQAVPVDPAPSCIQSWPILDSVPWPLHMTTEW